MTDIEFESRACHPVRLKYLLGEQVLASWRPELLVLVPQRFEQPGWPAEPAVLLSALEPGAQGLLCRKVPAAAFEPGLGRYGDFLRYVPYRDVLHYVELSGSFADYLKTFSPKSRQNLTRSVRRFGERQGGALSWRVYTHPEEMSEFHAQAVAISRKTYQAQLLDSGLPEGPEFLTELQALAGRGQARGYLLFDAGQPIAYAWCRQQGQRLVYDIVGYLSEYAQHSPGTVLLYHVLEDCFAAQRYSMLDFGPGEAQYKSMFATHRQEFVDLYLLRPSLRHRLLLRLHWWLLSGVDALGRWLERRGVKKKIKLWLRRLRG